MSQEDAFLHAIHERPDDDAPRLIYADWLDEHGQPERAELIRVQIERAALPADHPRRDALWSRLRRLQRHEQEWLGEFRLVLRGWDFRRGFVEEVSLGVNGFLANAEAMFRRWPIREVKLRVGEKKLPALMASPYLLRLHTLNLDSNALGDGAAEILASAPNLARLLSLKLNFNKITARGARALTASPHFAGLKHLALIGNPIGVETADELGTWFGPGLNIGR